MRLRNIVSATAQIAISCLLFALAWRSGFWQAVAYLLVLSAASISIVAYLRLKDPELLKRRSRGPQHEKQRSQMLLHIIVLATFALTLALASLDHAYAWSRVPFALEIAGDGIVALGCLVYFIVFRENTFAAATVELAPGQRVISSGPYAIVRHPMYVGLLAVLAGTPIALGSWWGLTMVVPMILAVLWRIHYEETFLMEHLPGYATYAHSVRHRLVPYVW